MNGGLWIFVVIVALVFGGNMVRWAVHRHRNRVEGNPANAEVSPDYRPYDLPPLPHDEPRPGSITGKSFGGPLR